MCNKNNFFPVVDWSPGHSYQAGAVQLGCTEPIRVCTVQGVREPSGRGQPSAPTPEKRKGISEHGWARAGKTCSKCLMFKKKKTVHTWLKHTKEYRGGGPGWVPHGVLLPC